MESDMTSERMALVLGATGGIGSETAKALLRAGWRVRAMHRQAEAMAKRFAQWGPIEWVQGDAMRAADVLAAAQGVQVIVHGVNPAGYRNWPALVLPMIDNTIAAARAQGARIVLPGTIYNYSPTGPAVLTERTKQETTTRKGRIRIELERRLEAAQADGVRTLIVRFGDFLGPQAGGSWFSQAMVKPGRPISAVTYMGKHDVGHAWAYLPDGGETIARLLDRAADLAPFETFHFAGHWFERGVEIAEAVRRVVGRPDLPIRRFPWIVVRLAQPFMEQFREMVEMSYLWRRPFRLDNAKLVRFLGSEPHTPIDEAVRYTLDGLGCLPAEGGVPVLAKG